MGNTVTLPKPHFDQPSPIDKCPDLPGRASVVLPSVLMSRMADLVRMMFSSPANIYHPQIRDMLFDNDLEKTKVAIMMGFNTVQDNEHADVFPRIVVSAGDTWAGAADPVERGNLTNSLSADDEIFGLDEGFSHWNGRVAFNCISRNALESLLMAESIWIWMRSNMQYIIKDLCLTSFDVKVLKGPQPVQKPAGLFMSILSCDWSSGMTWATAEDTPQIGDVGTL